MTHFVVIGGGSWGAAIASSLQRAQQPVTVLARDQQTADMLGQGRCPKLADCEPIAPLTATTDHHCLTTATMIFVAVPVKANAESFEIIDAMQASAPPAIVALCAKGIVSDNQGGAMLLTGGSIFWAKLCRRGFFRLASSPCCGGQRFRHQSHTRCL